MTAIAIPNLTAAGALSTSDKFVLNQSGATGVRSTLGDVWNLFLAQGGTFTASVAAADLTVTGSLTLPSYTVADLPAATTAGRLVYVPDEAGGAVAAIADGTNWRRLTDLAVVS